MIHFRMLQCCLLGLIVMPVIRLQASDPVTSLGGPECAQLKGVAGDAFSYFDEPASAWGGDEAKVHLIQRASLRALVLFRLCPTVGEAVLSEHKGFKDRWVSTLIDQLKSPDGAYVQDAVAELPCRSVASEVCSLKRQIEAAQPPPKKPVGNSENRSLSLAEKVTTDAGVEFTEATGEILGATDNLAFVLEVFPEQFFAYMNSHPDVLESWLGQSHETLFRGMPDSRDSLADYKRQLIDKTSKYTPKDARLLSTRDKVLEMLKSAPVSSID